MKKIISGMLFICFFMTAEAQVQKKDSVVVDSTQMEKINKMPMDSAHQTIPLDTTRTPRDKNQRRPKDSKDDQKPGDFRGLLLQDQPVMASVVVGTAPCSRMCFKSRSEIFSLNSSDFISSMVNHSASSECSSTSTFLSPPITRPDK